MQQRGLEVQNRRSKEKDNVSESQVGHCNCLEPKPEVRTEAG